MKKIKAWALLKGKNIYYDMDDGYLVGKERLVKGWKENIDDWTSRKSLYKVVPVTITIEETKKG
jgi:hypothetical protein